MSEVNCGCIFQPNRRVVGHTPASINPRLELRSLLQRVAKRAELSPPNFGESFLTAIP
jgi:hypothetical protein